MPNPVSADEVASKLREYLTTDPDSEIVLLTKSIIEQPKYRFTPELGESIDDNLVFRILLPNTMNILTWSIVDRTGARDAFCYTFD